jgi:hypothetical protein
MPRNRSQRCNLSWATASTWVAIDSCPPTFNAANAGPIHVVQGFLHATGVYTLPFPSSRKFMICDALYLSATCTDYAHPTRLYFKRMPLPRSSQSSGWSKWTTNGFDEPVMERDPTIAAHACASRGQSPQGSLDLRFLLRQTRAVCP